MCRDTESGAQPEQARVDYNDHIELRSPVSSMQSNNRTEDGTEISFNTKYKLECCGSLLTHSEWKLDAIRLSLYPLYSLPYIRDSIKRHVSPDNLAQLDAMQGILQQK